MFLDHLREYGDVCHHPNDAFHVERQEKDRILKCRECDRGLSLRRFFCHVCTPNSSLLEAERYVAWTGDVLVPCRFSTGLLDSRTLATTVTTDYASVLKAYTLLKMLHAPFMGVSDPQSPTPEGREFFRQTLVSELDSLLERAEKETPRDASLLVAHALTFLKHRVPREADRYFDELVPYVKSVHRRARGGDKLFGEPIATPPFYRALNEQLDISRVVHQAFSPYSAAFDLVHVAALCFLGRTHFRWVCDLVLDFVFQFAGGYYEAAFPFPGLVPLDPVETELRREWQRSPPPLLALFSDDDTLADHYSDAFFERFESWRKAPLESRARSFFPRLLFRRSVDYYAFLAAREHHATGSNEETLISECKTIHRYVKQTASQVQAFRACVEEMKRQSLKWGETEKKCYWTVEVVARYLDMNPAWTKMGLEALKWFCSPPKAKGVAEVDVPYRAFEKSFGTADVGPPSQTSSENVWMPDKMYKYYMKSRKRVLPSSDLSSKASPPKDDKTVDDKFFRDKLSLSRDDKTLDRENVLKTN